MSKSAVSIEDIENTIESECKPVTGIDWRGLTIPIKSHLSVSDMMEFTSGVVQSCFAVSTGEYIPEVKDFAIRCAVLAYYVGVELPEDLESKCDLVYGSDIVDCVIRSINATQYYSMCTAIDKKIDNIAQSNIEALNKQMGEVVAGFEALEEKLSGVFGSIDNDTVSKVAGAIANGSFDENKLVAAFQNNMKHKDNVVPMPTEDEQ